jgi:hypothetical protein
MRSGREHCYFATAQIPICDLRPLLDSSTGRLVRPSWPDPAPGRDFMRSVGPVCDRPRGAIGGWTGERAYCDAKNLIRFAEGDSRSRRPHDGATVRVAGRYRRIYGDGPLIRLELGMLVWSDVWLSDSAVADIALHERIAVRGASRTDLTTPLEGAALIARRLAAITSAHRHEGGPASPHGKYVSARRMMLLVERSTGAAEPESVALTTSGDRRARIPVVAIRRSAGPAGLTMRQWRGSLWRVHTELEVLRQVHREWRAGTTEFHRQSLFDYLDSQLGRLARLRRNGVLQPTVLGFVQSAGLDVLGDFRLLADELRTESLGLARRLDLIVERTNMAIRDNPTPIKKYIVLTGGVLNTTENNFDFHDKAAGVFGSHNEISDSNFNAAGNAVIGDLQAAVERMLPELPEADRQVASVVMSDLESIAQPELYSNGERLKGALQRLAGIAVTAGAIGGPVIEAIRKITAAING